MQHHDLQIACNFMVSNATALLDEKDLLDNAYKRCLSQVSFKPRREHGNLQYVAPSQV